MFRNFWGSVTAGNSSAICMLVERNGRKDRPNVKVDMLINDQTTCEIEFSFDQGAVNEDFFIECRVLPQEKIQEPVLVPEDQWKDKRLWPTVSNSIANSMHCYEINTLRRLIGCSMVSRVLTVMREKDDLTVEEARLLFCSLNKDLDGPDCPLTENTLWMRYFQQRLERQKARAERVLRGDWKLKHFATVFARLPADFLDFSKQPVKDQHAHLQHALADPLA